MAAHEAIRDFIQEELLKTVGGNIQFGDNLLDDGMVDSLGMLRMLDFIEERFQHSVQPADFTLENFRSIDCIVSYLEREGAKS